MRFSCTGFARLLDEEGRYMLLINKGRLKYSGQRILTPVGGAFEVTAAGRAYLESKFGARDFEDGMDLRFRVDDSQAPGVVKWFNQRDPEQRELSVRREMVEELGEKESRTLTHADFEGVRIAFASSTRRDATTVRDVPEKLTAYCVEIFDVIFPDPTRKKLLRAAERARPDIYFARQEEIERNRMDDGTEIGGITSTLLP